MSAHPAPTRRLSVAETRHEVMFRDGQAVTLHPVMNNGVPERDLRALRLPHGTTVVLDLTELAPGIAEDLCSAAARDVPGTVFYALRQAYPSRAAFVHRACLVGSLLPELQEAA